MSHLLKKIPSFKSLVEARMQKESEFYEENRVAVLASYRFLMKMIPRHYPRLLQQKQKINELRYVFKQNKVHQTLDETKYKRQKLLQIVEEIKLGDYSRIGEFEVALYAEKGDIISEFGPYQRRFRRYSN